MIALRFSGYFQCRLPTDPDPTDEPRGVSGFMWAVAGEPDLDRIIRFHDPVAPRLDDPDTRVGVFVRRAVVNGTHVPEHPLVGARVDLLDEPRYEGRNGIVAGSGSEPIVPFTLRIGTKDVAITRDSGVTESPFKALQPKALLYSSPGVIAAATCIWNFGAALDARKTALIKARDALAAGAQNPQTQKACAALSSRLQNMDEVGPFATVIHDFRTLYNFPMKGAACVADMTNRLDPPVDTKSDWQIEFWMGAWDIDAMTGFVDGWIIIPQVATSGSETERSFAAKLNLVAPLEFADQSDD